MAPRALRPRHGDPEAIRRRYLKVDTATVADVLDVLGLPARYRTPVQSIGRWRVTAWQVPVDIPGATKKRVRVRPGDFVLADADGAIAIPARVAFKVLVEAERLTAKEIRIRRDLGRGASLEDVLKKYGHV